MPVRLAEAKERLSKATRWLRVAQELLAVSPRIESVTSLSAQAVRLAEKELLELGVD